MDVSANIQDAVNDATATTAASTLSQSHQMTFEDKLRQESILIPEDLTDIHIEAPYTNTDDADTTTLPPTTAPTTGSSSVAGRRNPPRKKNLKKKGADAAAANTVPPIQAERTIEQRREQVRPIIDKLTELQMNVSYPAIRELYKKLSEFIRTGEDAKIKIPFPEFSRKIKGELTNATYKPCWVKLEME
jgi:hypothetical protein